MEVTCTGAQPDVNRTLVVPFNATACVRVFTFDPEPWDVHTRADGTVWEQSRDARCPYCGTGTHVVKEG